MADVIARFAAVSVALVSALALSVQCAALSVSAQPQQGALFTISVADDLEIFGITAADGSSPFPLDPNASGYAVLLPEGSSLDTLSGQAQVSALALSVSARSRRTAAQRTRAATGGLEPRYPQWSSAGRGTALATGGRSAVARGRRGSLDGGVRGECGHCWE